jgi:hypothetical protein
VTGDTVIARLAAANPVPVPPGASVRPSRRLRPVLAAGLAAAAIAVPAAAFAGDIGGLFGFSTQGPSVPTADTPFATMQGLDEGLGELGFPTTLQLLDTRDGIAFYAARRADGTICVAVDSTGGRGLGCDLGSPAGAKFPSPQRPIFDFSRFSGGSRLAGFAADGVARVALVDASGATIASAPVVANVYAAAGPFTGATGVEALDASGRVVYARSFGAAP